MKNYLKKYEIVLQSKNGSFRELSLIAQSSSHARSIAEHSDLKKPDETICSVFPSSFLF